MAREVIAAHPFGTLLTVDSSGVLQTSFIPMLAREHEGAFHLLGHVAKANPHALVIEREGSATAQFLGPHAYVSASWYEAPYETVPTWNYVAVIAEGRLRPAESLDAVTQLAHTLEGERDDAWRIERLPIDVLQANLRGIVAFELVVERLHIKAKLSQNRSEADRARVIERLRASPRESDRTCAEAMRR